MDVRPSVIRIYMNNIYVMTVKELIEALEAYDNQDQPVKFDINLSKDWDGIVNVYEDNVEWVVYIANW